MAFSDYIARVFGKKPVWLYRIEVGAQTFHLVSRMLDYTTSNNKPDESYPTGQLFLSAPITRGEIIQSNLASRSDTWFRLPTSNAAIQAILDHDDVSSIIVTVWQTFSGDPDEEYVQRFAGRVVSVDPDLIFTTLNCEFAITEMRRSSVAEVMQRPCRHAHYFTNADGGGCRLVLADHQQTAPVTAASGRSLTVPLAGLQDDGVFLAGILEYNGAEYMIESHDGENIVLESEVPGLADDIAAAELILGVVDVLIAPGCNLTSENCLAFDNIENFGGFRWMLDELFDGRSIA